MNAESSLNPAAIKRCESLSWRVEACCAILVFIEVALIGNAVAVTFLDAGFFKLAVWLLLVLVGIIWLGTQALNYQLVRCGPQAHRFALARRMVNRPEFVVRMAFHLVINWSAIAAVLVAGFIVGSQPVSTIIAYTCIAASVAVWLQFNLLHRQVNRMKNLVFSSTIAATLIIASFVLAASRL